MCNSSDVKVVSNVQSCRVQDQGQLGYFLIGIALLVQLIGQTLRL